jgi:hypothetical protein
MATEVSSRYPQRVNPKAVHPLSYCPINQTRARTQAQRRGVLYERKVHQRLHDEYGLHYISGQWFTYFSGDQKKFCQIDGILLNEERKNLLICEVKYSHTSLAYWQVENLYVPLMREYLRGSDWTVAVCEIVKWYDPAVAFPVRPVLRESLRDVRVGEFAVHILNR